MTVHLNKSQRMIDTYTQKLTDQLQLGKGSLSEVLDGILEENAWSFGDYPDLLENNTVALKVAYEHLVEQQQKIEYMEVPTIKGYNATRWYLGPRSDSAIWEKLRKQLEEKGWSDEAIREADRQSTTVLSLTHPPAADEFRHLGLVVGKVQSGKTGNIAATIAKASTTAYRFFLVLSGLTDALRRQTQLRLDRDLTAHDRTVWHRWTSAEMDFVEHPKQQFQFDPKLVQLAVLKKNAAVLRRLLRKLKQTPASVLANTPFLIIDDESDQASVNSAKVNAKMTVINGLIREIVDVLPRVTYIGYTATPYANVLISPLEKENELPDLYPKDFIVALEPGEGYFGAASIFGQSALSGEAAEEDQDQDQAYNMVRTVPADEAASLRGRKGSAGHGKPFAVTRSLDAALKYYFLALAVRDLRGQQDQHSTMLVHTSHLKQKHSEAHAALTAWLEHFEQRLRSGDGELLAELESIYKYETEQVMSAEFGYVTESFDRVRAAIAAQLDEVEVIVENSDVDSGARLDYDSGPQKYLAIGGNVLSRGLTLEGLLVSYFLRTSNQYDTLMQMGRWFGYRSGYEDLPRLWMEESIRSSFRDLAMIEEEVRQEIMRYQREQLTPTDFAIRIRSLPGMAITARNKMQHARTVAVSYSGGHYQTYRFRRNDKAWLMDNWHAGSELIASIGSAGVANEEITGSKGHMFRQVPYRLVLDFLEKYNIHESQKHLRSTHILQFIQQRVAAGDAAYHEWNVGLLWPSRPAQTSDLSLGHIDKVYTARRSSINDDAETADIKALMSKIDLASDLSSASRSRLPKNPDWDEIKEERRYVDAPALLLLYPIDAISEPSEASLQKKTRVKLNAAMDVLGMGIMFAGSRRYSGDFVSIGHKLSDQEALDDDQEELNAGEAELIQELDDDRAEQADD